MISRNLEMLSLTLLVYRESKIESSHSSDKGGRGDYNNTLKVGTVNRH